MTKINRQVSIGFTVIILLLFIPWICPYAQVQAQNGSILTTNDRFTLPQYNGAIAFAVNGTYSTATSYNDSWTFTNLKLNGSATLQNFTVSTQNSNITIFSYIALNFTRSSSRLHYLAQGQGKQVFNFGQGAGPTQYSGIDWSVIVGNSTFLAEGDQWTISPTGTVVVNGVTGNISVIHWGFFDTNSLNLNAPFYVQHSVAITITVLLAVVVAVAVVIRVVSAKPLSKNKLSKNGQPNKQPAESKVNMEEA